MHWRLLKRHKSYSLIHVRKSPELNIVGGWKSNQRSIMQVCPTLALHWDSYYDFCQRKDTDTRSHWDTSAISFSTLKIKTVSPTTTSQARQVHLCSFPGKCCFSPCNSKTFQRINKNKHNTYSVFGRTCSWERVSPHFSPRNVLVPH